MEKIKYTNELPNKYIFNVLTESNDYLNENIMKISLVKPSNIFKHKIRERGEDLNKIIMKKLEDYDLFILSFEDVNFEINYMPLFPMIIDNKIIITNILFQQINGFNNKCKTKGDYINDLLFRVKETIGGYISNKKIDYKPFDENIKNINKNKIIKILPNIEYLKKNNHGWFQENTEDMLRYAIKTYKPKNIVECGSWYGKSTRFIKENSPDSKLYCFDKFQSLLSKEAFKSKKYNPINKFYFNFPRFETFSSNLSKYKNVYSISEDAMKAPEYMKNLNINVDMFFIDFMKNTKKLIIFLESIFKYYPNAIIVGDDYVFNSVKTAVKIIKNKYKNKYFKTLPEAYLVYSKPLKNYYVENRIKKDILKEYLEKGEFNFAFRYIKNFKINLNKSIDIENNTYYHLIAKFLRKYEKLDLLKELENYQKPKLIENDLLLTWKDYYDYYIFMS